MFTTTLALVLGVVAPARALDLSEWVPGLRLFPFLSQRVEWESNVFQVPSGEQSDFIFKTIPGFLLEYGGSNQTVSVGYRAEILRYVELTEQNTVNHIFAGQYQGQFARTTLTLRDDFIKTSEPPNTELTGPVESLTNILAPSVEYRFTDRLGAGLNYSWKHVDYLEDQFSDLDRNEQLFGVSGLWRLRPALDVILNYSYGFEHFISASERDNTNHIGTVGLRGDITPKISSTFRVGIQARRADTEGLEDYTGWIMGGGFTYKPTDRTSFNLITERSLQESTFGQNFFYVSTLAALGVEHEFMPRLKGNLRVTGGVNDYPLKETLGDRTDWRQDIVWGASVGLEYQFRPWLRFGIEYVFERRDSNFPEFDFTDHRPSIFVTLQF